MASRHSNVFPSPTANSTQIQPQRPVFSITPPPVPVRAPIPPGSLRRTMSSSPRPGTVEFDQSRIFAPFPTTAITAAASNTLSQVRRIFDLTAPA